MVDRSEGSLQELEKNSRDIGRKQVGGSGLIAGVTGGEKRRKYIIIWMEVAKNE